MQNKELGFLVCAILAVTIAVVSIAGSVWYHIVTSRVKRVLSAWQMCTIGIFIAVFCLQLPVCYAYYDIQDTLRPAAALFGAIFHSVKVFLADGEYSMVQTALTCCGDLLTDAYLVTALVFFFLSPIMTAVSVLSIFSNFVAEVRLKLSALKPLYIMSKLNPMSVALARTIRKEKKRKAVIVFADVYQKNDDNYEFICEAQDKDIGGICLRRDVIHLNIVKQKDNRINRKIDDIFDFFGIKIKPRPIEYFLIDDMDESENISHAIKLTEQYADKKREGVKIFVYATSAGSAHIIDSLKYKNIRLSSLIKKRIINDVDFVKNFVPYEGAEQTEQKNSVSVKNRMTEDTLLSSIDNEFGITRIDSVHNLVLNTFSGIQFFKDCAQDKVISILIIGMGEYGREIFKTAIWYCQADGYKLEINVIDNGKDRNSNVRDIEEVMMQECPEILSHQVRNEAGDCQYDIRFFKNIDCYTNGFSELFDETKAPDTAKRLKRTKLAFVSLGNDDKNIEISIKLRILFDRLLAVSKKYQESLVEENCIETDLPIIQAVVFDDKKAKNLSDDGVGKLVNYKKCPYNIKFMGSFKEQFSYENIQNIRETDRYAIKYHTEWIRLTLKVRDSLIKSKDADLVREILAHKNAKQIEDINWYYPEEIYENGAFKPEEVPKWLIEQIETYLQFEYFRNSSVAKYLHKKALKEQMPQRSKDHKNTLLCTCETCRKSRITEHARWNAYMMVNGYKLGKQHASRSLTHNDLVSWEKLDILEQFKDNIEVED